MYNSLTSNLENTMANTERNKGIDWTLPGSSTNRNMETGIRYGVISQHSVMPEALDSVEYDYAGPNCPKCGNDALDFAQFENENETWIEANLEQCEHGHGCDDYICQDCMYIFDSGEAFSDESIGFHLDDGEYKLTDCLDSDIFVIDSPYYTLAQFCSPCVPGAGNLDNYMDCGVKTYCLGHDWFEDGIAPYPVYRVSDGVQVIAESK
jgi:hypothetical protein